MSSKKITVKVNGDKPHFQRTRSTLPRKYGRPSMSMENRKSIPFTVSLDPQTNADFMAIADSLKRPRAQLARIVIQEYVRAIMKKKP